MAFEFKFPDVGEGIHEGEIVKWRVKVGDEVKEDQPLVEMETAKAVVELPSPKAGKILEIRGKEGDNVKVGATLVVIDAPEEKGAVSAVNGTQVKSPPAKSAPGVIGTISTDSEVTLPPRGAEGAEDVASAGPGPATQTKPTAKSNKDEFGEIEHAPLKSIRKIIAEQMVKSVSNIPHVTHFDEFDASALVAARTAKKPAAGKKGIKLTYLPFIIKALIATLKKHPQLNSTFDGRGNEIVLKKYYNIGIAVDTEEGLMVPVIKNADQKDEFQIAEEIATLAQACRDRKIKLEEMQGATFSITNIGSVGGEYATPIIAYGQAGNLGIFRIKEKPVVVGGKVEVRPVLNLALSFDHRIVDGAEAARFMNDLMAELSAI